MATMFQQEAIYFDEGAGFLFIKHLGRGNFGSASLVRSLADNKLYVRKEEINIDDYFYSMQTSNETRPEEAKCATIVSTNANTIKLQGWIKYEEDPYGSNFTVSYWNYCNSGTLYDLITTWPEHMCLPERWVFSWVLTMLSTITDIHRAGIAHRDAHLKNWFLHRPDNYSDPVLVLGDFGTSLVRPENESDPQICPTPGSDPDEIDWSSNPDFDDGRWVVAAWSDFADITEHIWLLVDLVEHKERLKSLATSMSYLVTRIPLCGLEHHAQSIINRGKDILLHTIPPSDVQNGLLQGFMPETAFLPYDNKKGMFEFKTWLIAVPTEDCRILAQAPANRRRVFRKVAHGDWAPALVPASMSLTDLI